MPRVITFVQFDGCGMPAMRRMATSTLGVMERGKIIDFHPRIVDALRGYSWNALGRDAMAGIIVGVVALPLAIAFGIASGVSPEVGIFTAILGGFIVSLLGGSDVQIGGPTGAFIVVVYGIIQSHGISGLIVATMIAGALLLMMGFLRLGTLIKFIPYPIVVGFTAGIAVTIFSTQVNDFLGMGLTKLPGDFVAKWGTYASSLGRVEWLPFAFAAGSLLLTLFSSRIAILKKIPGSLIAIVLLTALSYALKEGLGISTLECVGDRFTISANLPAVQVPTVSLAMVRDLFPSAFTIALLGAIESLLSASVADGVIGGHHRSNTELIAQGAANLVVPLFGGIPVTGAIARTMTNIGNGGRSPIAGIVHAVVLLVLFLFLSSLINYVPMAVLAGILVVVSYNMSGWRSVVGILRGSKGDAVVMLVTFVLTVIIDLTVAIEVGMLLAMLMFMRRMVESTQIRVSCGTLRDGVEEHPAGADVEQIEIPRGVEVYEIEGPYFFGIANRFEETMSTIGDKPKVRIIRLRLVPFMDSTAVHNLSNLLKMCRRERIHVILSGVNPQVRATLKSSGIANELGMENILPSIHEALQRAADITGVSRVEG